MAGRLKRGVHLVRDGFAAVLSVVLIASSWGRWDQEPVFLVLDSLGGIFIVLSTVDVALVLSKSKRRGFFLANATYQLVPSFLIAGLLPAAGVPLLLLNAAALVTLREKRTPEELLAHPPVPVTRNYRFVVGGGLAAMFISLFLPWVTASDGSTVSLLAIYTAIFAHSGLPALTVTPLGAVFALLALVLAPIALLGALLGLRWRRMSGVAGILGIVTGGGVVAALPAAAGPGAFVYLAGGIVTLVAFGALRGGKGKRPVPAPASDQGVPVSGRGGSWSR